MLGSGQSVKNKGGFERAYLGEGIAVIRTNTTYTEGITANPSRSTSFTICARKLLGYLNVHFCGVVTRPLCSRDEAQQQALPNMREVRRKCSDVLDVKMAKLHKMVS